MALPPIAVTEVALGGISRYYNISDYTLVPRATLRGVAELHVRLWYAPVANVCDLLLFLDENRVIPEFRHF